MPHPDNWTINHKGDIQSYVDKKGWTPYEIQQTLKSGENMGTYGTVLTPGPTYGNTTIRIFNSSLNKSLIYDPQSSQIIQLGKPGYTW